MPRLLRETSAAARATVLRPYVPLLLLLAAGFALRVYTMAVYSTVVADYYTGDAGRYIRYGYPGIFEDEWQPAGYALILAGIRAVIDALTVTIAIQHLLGIVTGLVLFATARRAGATRGIALIPAGFVLLSGDHLFLEHAFLMESTWMALLAGGLYAAVRGGRAQDLRWIAGASMLLALSALVRNVSLLLPAVLALWLLLVVARRATVRLRFMAVAVMPAVLVLVAYSLVATSIGRYSGLGEMSGWSLYTRTAPFADCRQFTPPDGTRRLCETRPTGERPGPFFYYWDPASPAREVFPAMTPADGEKAGDFARAAILSQPLDFLRTVGKDVVRYFDPAAGFDRPWSGSTLQDMSFRRASPDPANTTEFAARVRTIYSGLDSTPDAGTSALETYQRIFRLNGLVLFVLFALTAVGLVLARGYQRLVCALTAAWAVVMLVLPPLVSSYDGRYSVPPAMLLSLSAALGAEAWLARRPGASEAAAAGRSEGARAAALARESDVLAH